jgi:hypothetical protein
VVDALVGLAKVRTLKSYASAMKSPMLIVGANNWIRERVPFFMLQQYDLHPLFYPNSMPVWTVGIAAFSRVRADDKPVFAFGSHSRIGRAMDKAIYKILELCRPDDLKTGAVPESSPGGAVRSKLAKLNMWWTNWIYRCPKISLKDVLHLEDYPCELAHWREFFRDGQQRLSMMSLNHPLLPAALRSVVRVNVPELSLRAGRNVNGIATWSDFRDVLA